MLTVYLLFILILVLWGARIKGNDDYISKDRCNSIKGIFILLIVLTHSMQYIDASGYAYSGIDTIVPVFRRLTGQLVVVMFLFYSGYGVSYSLRKKGKQYTDSMPRHRLLPTLLNFDVAVLVFIILNIILSIPMTILQIMMSFIGWDSVGNSNWYIFDILLCYGATYLIAKFVRDKDQWKWLFAIIVLIILWLSFFKRPYWYNTLLAYPAGFLFAIKKDEIVGVMRKHYAALLCLLALLFIVSFYFVPKIKGIPDNFASICFALIIVMLTMKIQIGNKVLNWCGTNLFPIYIYQRIPMTIMNECLGADFVRDYAPLFVFTALAVTCIIAYFYKYWQIKRI